MNNIALNTPLSLPCGASLKNRLAKSGMSEHMADYDNSPSSQLVRLYKRWSAGGAGLLITGNVMLDPASMTSRRNVVLGKKSDLKRFRDWARAGTSSGNHLWIQINHPGRQTPRYINKSPVSASSLDPVDLLKKFNTFSPSHALVELEIKTIIDRFCLAAEMAQESGFTGVEVHAAHGYLISQFLSPLTNRRDDNWGGNLENRARFLRQIVRGIRNKVGNSYPLSVKLNSADFQRGGFEEDESIQVVKWLAEDAVDVVHVSGGNYEAQAMFDLTDSKSTRIREAYFLEFARRVRQTINIPLLVTGGFRTVRVMQDALESNALDVIGMARPLAAEPDLPRLLMEGRVTGSGYRSKTFGYRKLNYLSESFWCMVQFNRMARDHEAVVEMNIWWAMICHIRNALLDSVTLTWRKFKAGQ